MFAQELTICSLSATFVGGRDVIVVHLNAALRAASGCNGRRPGRLRVGPVGREEGRPWAP